MKLKNPRQRLSKLRLLRAAFRLGIGMRVVSGLALATGCGGLPAPSAVPLSLRIGSGRCAQASLRTFAIALLALLLPLACFSEITFGQNRGFQQTIDLVQPAMVKIVGSGGFQGLEPYQSGFLISNEGHVLTVWSYVLDSDGVTVTLNNGQKFEGKLVGYDPRIEIAVLKIDSTGLSNFDLGDSADAQLGARVLAFSNLYGVATGNEPASVQHGIVSTKTKLAARRGAFESTYQGEVFVLDAVTNNPGSAGGAVTDRQGRLIGLIGKELRDTQTNSWLNFAIPIDQLTSSVNDILGGKMVVATDPKARKPSEPMTTNLLGIVLVPNIVSRTPPYIDRVIFDSAAAKSGLLPDDLIVEINGRMTPSNKEVLEQLSFVDRDSEVSLVIQRRKEFKSVTVRIVR